MSTNTAKYLSYKEAWRRIKDATEQGFYFEVVTLCESIISDRLLSYVRGVDPTSKISIRTPFSTLITQWRKLASGKLTVPNIPDLGKAVDAWRDDRNIIIHSLTKSEPGSPTEDLQPFIVRAEQAALTGAILARAVSEWHKKQLRANQSAITGAIKPATQITGKKSARAKKETTKKLLNSLNKQLSGGHLSLQRYNVVLKQRNDLMKKITKSGKVSVVSGGLPSLGKRSR